MEFPGITPFGVLLAGLLAGAVATAAMDLVWFVRYRRGGGQSSVLQWEFSAGLNSWEQAPAPARVGKRIVEADWRLFCTLIRFDVVYHGHFKCNLRRIVDYPNLQAYMLDLYQQPGIVETVSIDHIKRHYYMTHEEINPTRIVPLGPIVDLARAHGRERMK